MRGKLDKNIDEFIYNVYMICMKYIPAAKNETKIWPWGTDWLLKALSFEWVKVLHSFGI